MSCTALVACYALLVLLVSPASRAACVTCAHATCVAHAHAPRVALLVSNMLHATMVCNCQSEKNAKKKKTKDAMYRHCGGIVIVALREGTFARGGGARGGGWC